MGKDFSALIRYDGLESSHEAITSFVSEPPGEFNAVERLWGENSFFAIAEEYQAIEWIDLETDQKVERPKEVELNVSLRTPEGFFITFGHDSIYVYHLLRWKLFLTERAWRSTMLDACTAIARHFDGSDCVLAHDCHPAMSAFRRNQPFDRSFDSLSVEENEVPNIDDLLLKVEFEGQTFWDSIGFWRFDWREHQTK